jgi:S-adenosyl-L-methionine hydrolase (adenosine-forming)
MPPLVTLTTDFGAASPYVAAMKGVLLGVNPEVRIHDLSHAIPPQDVRHASYFLAGCVPYFPAGTIHVCVVDPGVGTKRALLLAEAGGQFLLAPDNGCLTGALAALHGKPVVRRLGEPRFWRNPVSSTFHGRDILAPAAGHLSLGVKPAEFGPTVADWVRLENPEARIEKNRIRGEVIFIDDFGNLITNIRGEMIRARPEVLVVGKRALRQFHWVKNYAEASPGELVALISSEGWLEIAIVQGHAARKLGARVGTLVSVGFRHERLSRIIA